MKPESFEPAPSWITSEMRERTEQAPYGKLLGFRWEEVRRDYARLRLPFRPELNQPAGMIHGGAIASLIDTVVVGAILSGLDAPPRRLLTIDLHVHYLDAAVNEDVVAEARVRRRGRSLVFLEVEARGADGREIAHGEICYRVSA